MKSVKIKYPNSQFYVDVRLYDTVKEVQRRAGDKNCAAMYRPNGIIIFPKRKVYPKLGTIMLSKERLGAGLIAHEVFHCSLDYAHKKFNVGNIRTENNERQEDVAYFLGYVVKEIVNWLNDNNFWK